MNKITKLEAIRGLTALYVVLHHTIKDKIMVGGFDLGLLFRFGQEAVIIFFILSGFVIQLSFQKGKDKSFKLYFLKRFFRIFIPLFIIYIASYIFRLIETGKTGIDVYNLLGNILMLQDAESLKLNVICKPFLDNSPLWSLSYEWWFYMLFFLYFTIVKNTMRNVVYILGVAATISYIFYPFFVNRLMMYMVIWYVGVEMANLYMEGKDINFKNLRYAFITLFICTVILSFNLYINKDNWSRQLGIPVTIGVSPWLEVRHFGSAIVVMIFALLWKKSRWIGFNHTIAPFEFFASVSFGMYISHYFLVSHAHYLDFIDVEIIRYTLYLIICYGFSYVIEHVVYIRLNKKLMGYFYYNSKKVNANA